MFTNTKSLFAAILRAHRADCVLDIGSRDGDQALLFRHLLPTAAVAAFEANTINFAAMRNNPRLKEEHIDLFAYAISNERGVAHFHVADIDYADPEANRGTSSLLVAPGQRIQSTVSVETRRVDEFIGEYRPHVQRIGLWIDVEGAEYAVLEGARGIKDKVLAVHVETANEPIRQGQRAFRDLVALMNSYGFHLCGRNFGTRAEEWGDVVFIQDRLAREMGASLQLCKCKAVIGYWLRADQVAAWSKRRCPRAYRCLRRLYLKLGT